MVVKVLTLVIFGAAAVVGVWDLLQIEAIDNALIQFATAGVIPGTQVALTPGQMYVLLGVILLLVVCLLFRKGIMRDLRAMRTFLAHPLGGPVVASHVASTADEPAMAPPAREASVEPSPSLKEHKSEQKIIITIPRQPGRIVKAVRFIRPRVIPALYAGGHRLRIIGRRLWRWTGRTVTVYDRKSRVYAQQAWQYTEPRIRAWDAKIEKVLKRNARTAWIVRKIEREYAFLSGQYTQWRSKSRRAVEK